jgi:hypothetical protein
MVAYSPAWIPLKPLGTVPKEALCTVISPLAAGAAAVRHAGNAPPSLPPEP